MKNVVGVYSSAIYWEILTTFIGGRLPVNDKRKVFRKPSDSDCWAVKAKALQAWNTGASMLFRKNLEVFQLLRANVWASQTIFTSSYLRDITHRSTDTFSIGTVVAAQQVV